MNEIKENYGKSLKYRCSMPIWLVYHYQSACDIIGEIKTTPDWNSMQCMTLKTVVNVCDLFNH